MAFLLCVFALGKKLWQHFSFIKEAQKKQTENKKRTQRITHWWWKIQGKEHGEKNPTKWKKKFFSGDKAETKFTEYPM